MADKRVEELVRELDKQLALLYETNDHGKAFLSPNIRGKIINVFLSHPDLLVSESTNYTLNDILMKRETMKGGYITGADAEALNGEVKASGKNNR